MKFGWKRISAIMVTVFTVFGMQMSALAAVNPFSMNGTQITNSNTEFTVKLTVPESKQLDAYQLNVTYDASILKVKGEEGVGYKYTDAFTNQYGIMGLCELNSLPQAGKLIFAGANADSQSAVFKGDLAQITFSILDKTKTVNDVLTSITVGVNALTVGNMAVDVTGMQANYPITITNVKLGDINGDGSVDLVDANMALKAALNITQLTDDQKKAADADGNGQIDLTDANMILKAALNIITLG